jgi:hypothetical protein
MDQCTLFSILISYNTSPRNRFFRRPFQAPSEHAYRTDFRGAFCISRNDFNTLVDEDGQIQLHQARQEHGNVII